MLKYLSSQNNHSICVHEQLKLKNGGIRIYKPICNPLNNHVMAHSRFTRNTFIKDCMKEYKHKFRLGHYDMNTNNLTIKLGHCFKGYINSYDIIVLSNEDWTPTLLDHLLTFVLEERKYKVVPLE